MKRQSGFTLIELVVVIVILGILAVTAAPRFLSLTGDARKSSLQGLKGAMVGATGITYGKSAIEGEERISAGKDVNGIATVYGYPSETSAGIGKAVTGLTADWDTFADTSGFYVTFKADPSHSSKSDITDTECYIQYVEAANSVSEPTITVDDDNC